MIAAQTLTIWKKLTIGVVLCLAATACTHTITPDIDTVKSKWYGQPMAHLVQKLGSPHHTTRHPDGEIQYIYQFREKPIYEDIFRGKFLSDMSTIRIQEELAREKRFTCLMEVFVQHGCIVRMELTGSSCADIRHKLVDDGLEG